MQEGMKLEWRNEVDACAKEGVADASRFSLEQGVTVILRISNNE